MPPFFWILLTVAIVAILNTITLRSLTAFHPRRKIAILLAATACNLLWLAIPFILSARTSPSLRVVRAVLGPLWFSWIVFILIYSSFVLALATGWLVFRRRDRDFPSFGKNPSRIFLTSFAVLSLLGLYDALVPLRSKTVTVQLEGLPQSLRGYRIALLSDIHVGLFTRGSRLRQIAARINDGRPDLVALAGDFIDDDPYFVPKLLGGISALSTHAPVLAVLGNHEMYGDPTEVIRALDGSRIKLLVNRGVALGPGGRLWVAGLSDFAGDRPGRVPGPILADALAGRPPGTTTIVLAHQPKAFALARRERIPLTLVGHTHGGQLGCRPLNWSLAGVFLPFHMGLYIRGSSQLFVTTGAGYWLVPFRLGMSPEIVFIDLVPAVSKQ